MQRQIMGLTNERTLTDAAGVTHAPVAGEPRIVSLVPSLTELLCDLGLARHVVGRTGFCIHPRGGARDPQARRHEERQLGALARARAHPRRRQRRRKRKTALVNPIRHVLLPSEPYRFRERDVAELEGILPRHVKVSLIDGEMTSWYGSRAIAGLTYLARFRRRLLYQRGLA